MMNTPREQTDEEKLETLLEGIRQLTEQIEDVDKQMVALKNSRASLVKLRDMTWMQSEIVKERIEKKT